MNPDPDLIYKPEHQSTHSRARHDPTTSLSAAGKDVDDEGAGMEVDDIESIAGPGGTKSKVFVTKLWSMMDDPASTPYINWAADGNGFTITNHSEFATSVLEKIFKHSNFQSFTRQLNLYGFLEANKTPRARRGAQEARQRHYTHPHFVRGRPDLLHTITLKTRERKALSRVVTGGPSNNVREEDPAVETGVSSNPVDFGLDIFQHASYATLNCAALVAALRETISSVSHLAMGPGDRLQDIENATLAHGGYGDIQPAILNLGTQHLTNFKVAIKKLRPAGDSVQQLRVAVALAREIRVWSTLHHSNITRLVTFRFDPRAGVAWLVSPWEEHGCITTFLERNNLSLEERLLLAVDTLRALVYMHTRSPSVCHGDLKPANVLINHQRQAMLCDFGLARAMDDVPSGLTTTKAIVGTTRYASPEVLLHAEKRTLASDMWSWGCLSFEIATGHIPYEAMRKDSQVLLAVARNEHPATSTKYALPLRLMKVLERCWYLLPEDRLTAQQCLEEVECAVRAPGEMTPSAAFEWSRRPRRRTPTIGPQQPGNPFPPDFVPWSSSRSDTPRSQPGGQQLGMSLPGIGMPPGVQRPGAQIGGQRQHFPLVLQNPLMVQAMQSLGLGGRPHESLTWEEWRKVQQVMGRILMQNPGNGMGSPRVPSGGPPPGTQAQAKMPPPGVGQGSPGVQGGPSGPGYVQSPFNQPILGARGQLQAPNNLKRSRSPVPEAAMVPQGSSPPNKRRKNDENGVPASGYAPGAPNGMTGPDQLTPQQVPQPLSGQHPMMDVPGNMMRPRPGPGHHPQQINPMMIVNGAQVQNAHLRHMRNQHRYGPMLPGNKGGIMANPNPSGLPIPVPPGAGGDTLTDDQPQASTQMEGRKVLPSPSLSAAKAPGLMPPSRTPNPLHGSKVKGEEAASAKSSPANKAAPPPRNATSGSTPMPAPSTPAPQQLGPNLFGHTIPSPSLLNANVNANHATPPPNASRPGPTANHNLANPPNHMPISGALAVANKNYTFNLGPLDVYDLEGFL